MLIKENVLLSLILFWGIKEVTIFCLLFFYWMTDAATGQNKALDHRKKKVENKRKNGQTKTNKDRP